MCVPRVETPQFRLLHVISWTSLPFLCTSCDHANVHNLLSEGGDCLILAIKKRCRNNMERRGRRRHMARRCEINFIPKVFLEDDLDHEQRLTCRPFLAGYGACPELRPEGQGSVEICDPLLENSKRCETSQDKVQTSCRAFEICDQAVLLSGGWDQQVSLPRHLANMQNMYRMLRAHGFKRRNIELFFADGLESGLEGQCFLFSTSLYILGARFTNLCWL